ncbi:Ribosomal protein S6 modification protein [Rubripirellula lacrimiformis]|uniref:Ribosomal protein S6 modification protein n=1 Tax=Rubripirellula lacrimiformis TaxID=1930273 RepID=A0A517NB85_9BACT|nr:RimK family alpha-L-glutamate ligase [Rubripirellula lacrimiformis]QDT04394.1 Ribosomal protein S6 modification protein [Rubripirellula lacrimiformis]
MISDAVPPQDNSSVDRQPVKREQRQPNDGQRRQRFLVLGGGEGWHANQLRSAADDRGCEIAFGTYPSLSASIGPAGGTTIDCDAGSLATFDAILTRTMPMGTIETLTFRLATLHGLSDAGITAALVNPARSLEIAIDKFATLAKVASLGYPVPETVVVQSRSQAIDAFRSLGGDVVVKPIFGGEGRGVMRVRDPELAWYTFSTLESLGAVAYVQAFVPPGGRDRRLLVIGDQVWGFRRTNERDFRTNVSGGGETLPFDVSDEQSTLAKRICQSIGLKFASVDLLDCEGGPDCVVEVNGIPGWKGAQAVCETNLADQIISLLCHQAAIRHEVAA